MPEPLVLTTANGLYCPAGGFHIDPWRPVERAVITHAHGDHLRNGNAHYDYSAAGASVVASRLVAGFSGTPHEYGETFELGNARVSLHPAGHVLGSAQVRIEAEGQVWVVSGDYKRDPDPTCAPFEVVPCDVFISEATFALPVYRWPSTPQTVAELKAWWDVNRDRGVATVVFCYALGKAQRVLAELAALTNETVYVHGALLPLIEDYRAAGITLVPTAPATSAAKRDYAGALVLAPPSAAGSTWMRRFGEHVTAFCSGWMQVRGNRRRRGYDRGFVISDHADWPSLLRTFREVDPRRVLLTHGYSDAMVRYLNETGVAAEALATAFSGEAAAAED
ncbi:MAG: ligase-associated DNA damage response exonuclease [Steroidobacteraceae bacterium]